MMIDGDFALLQDWPVAGSVPLSPAATPVQLPEWPPVGPGQPSADPPGPLAGR